LKAPEKILRVRLLTGFISFLITIFLSSHQAWQVGDIVWSVWLASLVTSVALIFVALVFAPLAKKATRRVLLDRISTAYGNLSAQRQMVVLVGITCLAAIIVSVSIIWLHGIQATLISLFFGVEGVGAGRVSQVPFRAVVMAYWEFTLLALLFNVPLYAMFILGKREADMTLPFVFLMHNFFIIFGIIFVSAVAPDVGARYFALVAYFFPFEIMADRLKARRARRLER